MSFDNYEKVKEALKLSYETRLHPTSPFIPLFVSETGIGKTTMIYDAMHDIFGNDHNVVYINLASISPTDFGGFPLIDKENKKVDRVPLDEFKLLVDADVPTLFFLDEWNRFKDIGMLQVLFNLLRRKIGNKEMSDYVFFCAAENPVDSGNDVYFVIDRDAALYARVVEIKLEKDRVSFYRYIMKKGYDNQLASSFMAMLDSNKDFFNKYPNRVLENVLVVFSNYDKKEWVNRDSRLYFFISSMTDPTFASLFYKYLTNTYVSIEKILKGELKSQTIDKILAIPYDSFYITMSLIDYVDEKLRKNEYNETSMEIVNMRKFVELLKERNAEIFVSLYEMIIKKYDKGLSEVLMDMFRRDDGDDHILVAHGYEDIGKLFE